MTATHDGLSTFVISLEPAGGTVQSFTNLLLIADQAGGTTLGGTDRVRSYSSYADAVVDTAVLSTKILGWLQLMFAQPRRPTTIKVARCNTAGSETYAAALAATIAVDPDFFGVCIESRLAAQIEGVATAVNALDRKRVFFFQSADADILVSGGPDDLDDTDSVEWAVGVYHDENNVASAECYAAYGLGVNPDNKSGTWLLNVVGPAALTDGLTSAELAFLKANFFNVALPNGSATRFVANAVNRAGRPIDQLITHAWYIARAREGVIGARLAASARGDKITVDIVGQELVRSVLNEWLQRGQAGSSPHFLPGQTSVTMPTLTDADRTARTIPAVVQAAFATDMLGVSVTGNFSTTLLFEVCCA